MSPTELVARAAALRFPQTLLAQRAGVDEMTVHRVFSCRTDPRSSTLRKLAEAVIAEERALLAHLLSLHGVPTQETEQAGALPG